MNAFSSAQVVVDSDDSPLKQPRFRSPLRYPGGKQRAISQIAGLLPKSVNEYREPMVGGGSVYFHARSVRLADRYWINDLFAELVAFWTCVQDEETCKQLVAELEQLRSSFGSAEEIKRYFLEARKEEPTDKFRMALLFFFFNRVTFSGTTRAGGFSSEAGLTRFTRSSIERLEPMPSALERTKISCQDFQKVIKKPGDDVFIFLDPPYFTPSKLYGNNGDLHRFDHERLATLLRTTKHKFLVTYDDCEDIRQLYRWANLKTWNLQYGMNNCSAAGTSKIGSELFISNY